MLPTALESFEHSSSTRQFRQDIGFYIEEINSPVLSIRALIDPCGLANQFRNMAQGYQQHKGSWQKKKFDPEA